MNPTTIIVSAITIITIVGMLLCNQNARLKRELLEASEQIRLQESIQEATLSAIGSTREKENELHEQRKKLAERLESAACTSGPAYIDVLVELLNDDSKARCR